MAVGNLYVVSCHMSTAGTEWEWQWAYQQVAGTNDANTLDELCVDFNLAINTELRGCIASDTNHRWTDARPIPGVDEIPGSAPPVASQGTVIDASLPTNMAAKIYWTTNAPNSKFNGRTNISGVPSTFQNDGVLSGPAIAAYNALTNVLGPNLQDVGTGAAEFQPVIISRYLDGVKRVAPVPYAIVSAGIGSAVGNMRRRTTRDRVFEF